MLFHDRLPVTPSPIFDAAFFAKGTLTNVPVRDAEGNITVNSSGEILTVKGEVRDLLAGMADDRARLLAQAANNQRYFVEQANEWVGTLSRAYQELQRVRPNGNDSNKNPRVNVPGFSFKDNGGNITLSKQTANALYDAKDSTGTSLLTKYFGLTPPTGGYTASVSIEKMADGKAFATLGNALESVMDQTTQRAQLEQTSYQGLVSRHNNAVETMADLQTKFASAFAKLAANLRLGQ